MLRNELISRLLLLGFTQHEELAPNNGYYILGPISVTVSKRKVTIEVQAKELDDNGRRVWNTVSHDFNNGFLTIIKRLKDNEDRI